MKVTFAALVDGKSSIDSTSRQINQQLADLKQYLAPLVASWEGSASTAYQEKQKAWDTAAEDMNQVLAQIGTAIGVAEQNYREAETTNANRWHG